MGKPVRYYLAAELPCTVESEDAVSHAAFAHGALGCEIREGRVIAYFPDGEPQALRARLREALQAIRDAGLTVPQQQVVVRRFREENWQDAWKAFFKPVRIGGSLTVHAPWHRPPPGTKIPLVINPARAFGTGTHETTQLILEYMVQHRARLPERALDVGTGSGILAIAHALLCPGSRIVGLDVDPAAVENAIENAALNRVTDRCLFFAGTLAALKPVRFPIIYANLETRIILPMLQELAGRIEPAGTLLLSGILDREADNLTRAARATGLDLDTVQRRNEWCLIACRAAYENRI